MRPAKAVEQAANLVCDFFIVRGGYFSRKSILSQCERIYDEYEDLDDPEELASMVISNATTTLGIKELTRVYFPKDMEV